MTNPKARFTRQLAKLGFAGEITRRTLAELGETFSLRELRDPAALMPHQPGGPGEISAVAGAILSLAASNHVVRFPPVQRMPERVIFPHSPSQSHGIVDARIVRFRDENGETTYPPPPPPLGGQYVMLSRQDNENIFLMRSDDLHFWREAVLIVRPTFPWEFIQPGNCGPPSIGSYSVSDYAIRFATVPPAAMFPLVTARPTTARSVQVQCRRGTDSAPRAGEIVATLINSPIASHHTISSRADSRVVWCSACPSEPGPGAKLMCGLLARDSISIPGRWLFPRPYVRGHAPAMGSSPTRAFVCALAPFARVGCHPINMRSPPRGQINTKPSMRLNL